MTNSKAKDAIITELEIEKERLRGVFFSIKLKIMIRKNQFSEWLREKFKNIININVIK